MVTHYCFWYGEIPQPLDKKFDHMHSPLIKHKWGHFSQNFFTVRWRYFNSKYTAKGFIKIPSLD